MVASLLSLSVHGHPCRSPRPAALPGGDLLRSGRHPARSRGRAHPADDGGARRRRRRRDHPGAGHRGLQRAHAPHRPHPGGERPRRPLGDHPQRRGHLGPRRPAGRPPAHAGERAAVETALASAGRRLWVTYEAVHGAPAGAAAGGEQRTGVYYAGHLRREIVTFLWGPQAPPVAPGAAGPAPDGVAVGLEPRWDWRRARSPGVYRDGAVLGCWCIGSPLGLAPLDAIARAGDGRLEGARYLPWSKRLGQFIGRPGLALLGRDLGAADASKGAGRRLALRPPGDRPDADGRLSGTPTTTSRTAGLRRLRRGHGQRHAPGAAPRRPGGADQPRGRRRPGAPGLAARPAGGRAGAPAGDPTP